MLILLILSLLFGLIHNLNLTIVDQGENITVALQKYFNHSLQYPAFEIDRTKSVPENIEEYFDFSFQKKFYETNSVEMKSTKGNKTFSLNQYTIYQTLSIDTQPLKLFLTEETLMMVLFDDQFKGESTIISVLNLSEWSKKTLSCKEQTFDPKKFRLFVQCLETPTNSPITMLVTLERDTNSIVNSMIPIEYYNTSDYLKDCQHRKIMYANEIFIIPSHYSIQQVFLYCPPAFNKQNKLLAISFNANFSNIDQIINYNFDNCTKNCCDAAQNIFYLGKDEIYIQTKNTLYQKNNNNGCTVVITYENFISLRIGSVIQSRDIYILSQTYLYVKYPAALTNYQQIDITEPDMSPVAFTVTKDYIITQLLNQTNHKAILKVHKIVNWNPKLLDVVEIEYSSILLGTENYLEEADYMYLFDLSSNLLSVAYYQGIQLNIAPIVQIGQRGFEVVIVNFDQSTKQLNQSLNVFISVYNFQDSRYFVDYSQLSYVFEESFVRIPLRDGVVGPLVQFYTIDPISLDKQFLNGMYLIDMQKALFYEDSVENIVGLLLERNNNLTEPLTLKFALKFPKSDEQMDKGQKEYIFLYDCSLIYNISVFEIDKCNNLTLKIINQSIIRLNSLKGFFYVKNPMRNQTDPLYLLYDTSSILLCNNTFCQQKIRPGVILRALNMKVINSNSGVYLMQLRDDSKSLRFLQLGNINDDKLIEKMEINEKKLTDLNQPNVIITDYYTDEEFQKLLIVQLNNSKVYVMQKQTIPDQQTIFCHATSLIQLSNITICTEFSRTFFLSQGSPDKIVILCSSNKTLQYHLVEFKINNVFDVQKSREYPLYKYTVHPNSSLHFSDNQFIYIALANAESSYLVYNTLSITPNVLMEKIPATNYYNLVGSISNQVKSKGYGLIDKHAFVVSSSYYEGILNISETESVIEDIASFAVKNHNNQLSLVEFEITINLTKSQIGYSLSTDTFLLQNRIQVINISIEISKLSGPVTTAQIDSTCEYWPEIEKKDIVTVDQIINQKEFEQQLLDGKFLSYVSLNTMELIVTSNRLLCIKNKTIMKWENQPYTDCKLTNFSSGASEQAFMSCMYYRAMIFRIIKVSQDCEMTFEEISMFSRVVVSSFKTSYPYLFIQLPILDKENKNYQSCVFNESSRKFQECEYLTNNLRKYFLAVDYDIYEEYGLILERGIRVYDLSSPQKDLVWYISDDDLATIGIESPYKYGKIVNISRTPRYITVEIANDINAYQLQYDFRTAKIIRTYQQYVDCTNIYHKSIDVSIYKIKICDFLQPSVDILDEIIELERKPRRIVQFYLREGQESYPVSMYNLTNSSYIFLSQNQIVSISPELYIWYYDLAENISWILSFNWNDNEDQKVCAHNLVIQNDHFIKEYPLKFYVDKVKPSSTLVLYLAHIPFVCLVLAFPLIKKYANKNKKQKLHSISKKISYKKNFYSNDFEDQLKSLSESLVEPRGSELRLVEQQF